MDNPYTSPKTASDLPEAIPAPWKMKILRGVATTSSVLALLVFAVIALMLIPQASRFASEAPRLPTRAQPGHYAIARASGLAGATAIVGIVLNIVALVFIRRRRIMLSFFLLGISIVAMVAVAIIFNPA